jgi:DNA (cytosine-5)-methyltransferase 1
MLRVIREVSPKWIVGENVFGIVNWSGGLVFEEVQADLEREGYEVQSYILPAAGVDAPHKRDRVWFVAYSSDNGEAGFAYNTEVKGGRGQLQQRQEQGEFGGCNSENGDASNTSIIELQRGEFGRGFGCEGEVKGEGRQFSGPVCSSWQNFPTQSPVCIGNDGISSRLDTTAISFPKWRNESIKAAGNAIVPQVVLQIFKAIQAYEDSI